MYFNHLHMISACCFIKQKELRNANQNYRITYYYQLYLWELTKQKTLNKAFNNKDR